MEELARVLDTLACYHERRGDNNRALSCYSISLSKKAQWRDLPGLSVTLRNLGRLHLQMGDPRAATSCLRDGLRIAEDLGDARLAVTARILLGRALTELARVEEAAAELTAALGSTREQGGWPEAEALALTYLAQVRALTGGHDEARELLDGAVALLPRDGSLSTRGEVFLARGEVCFKAGDADGAQHDYQTAYHIFSALRSHAEEAAAQHGLARVAEQRNGPVVAPRPADPQLVRPAVLRLSALESLIVTRSARPPWSCTGPGTRSSTRRGGP